MRFGSKHFEIVLFLYKMHQVVSSPFWDSINRPGCFSGSLQARSTESSPRKESPQFTPLQQPRQFVLPHESQPREIFIWKLLVSTGPKTRWDLQEHDGHQLQMLHSQPSPWWLACSQLEAAVSFSRNFCRTQERKRRNLTPAERSVLPTSGISTLTHRWRRCWWVLAEKTTVMEVAELHVHEKNERAAYRMYLGGTSGLLSATYIHLLNCNLEWNCPS